VPSLKCNGLAMISMAHGELVVDGFGLDPARGSEAEDFARPVDRQGFDEGGSMWSDAGQITAFGQELARQSVEFSVGATLPWAVRLAEVHWPVRGPGEFAVVRHLVVAVVGEARPQFGADAPLKRRLKPLSACEAMKPFIWVSKTKRLVHSTAPPMLGVAPSLDEAVLPVAGHLARVGFGRALAWILLTRLRGLARRDNSHH